MNIIIIVIISKREVKAARAHMMPPQVHVYDELASPVNDVCRMYYKICEVIRFVAAPV